MMSYDISAPLLHESKNTCNFELIEQESEIFFSDTECEASLNAVQKRLLETTNNRNLNSDDPLPEGKDAHFFISYSSNDRSTVLPIILELEQTHRFACIFDDRDFISGMKILDNIKRSMERSMKVLLFVSDNFLQSGYCKYENDLAFVMSLRVGRNIIIPVKLGECEVPSTLETLTYIDGDADNLEERIIEAYNNTVTDFLPEDFGFSRKWENGFSICLPGETESVCCLRPNRRKIVLDDPTRHVLNVGKFKVSEKTVQDAADIINSYISSDTWTRSTGNVCSCLCLCTSLFIILALLLIWGIIGVTVYDRHFSQKSADVQTNYLIAALTVMVAGSFTTCIGMCVYYARRVRADRGNLKDDIFKKITLQTYKDGVVFIVGSLQSEPTIEIIRFNIRPCQAYLARKIKQFVDENYEGKHAYPMNVYEQRADLYDKRRLKVDLFERITLKTYRDGVYFKVTDNDFNITIEIIRYNIRPCQVFLASKIKQFVEENYGRSNDYSMEEYDERADVFIRNTLSDYIYYYVPGAPDNRHNVIGGRSCLCQFLEPYVGKHVQVWLGSIPAHHIEVV